MRTVILILIGIASLVMLITSLFILVMIVASLIEELDND